LVAGMTGCSVLERAVDGYQSAEGSAPAGSLSNPAKRTSAEGR
jgi:hypothetical protein